MRPSNAQLIKTSAILGCGSLLYVLFTRLGLAIPIAMIPKALCFPDCNETFHTQAMITARSDQLNSSTALSALIPEPISPEQISILIDKSDYRLTIFHQGKPIKDYSVVFGDNPRGDKQREGDRKTPEGIFGIRDQYPHPTWSKFIWLDYPTPHSWRKHLSAKLSGQIRPLTTIGGEVGIHGVPDGADDWIEAKQNWTLGCISLKNSDVNEIYDVIGNGTVVEIVP